MKLFFKRVLVSLVALSAIGCGNYDYDVVVDHAAKLEGTYFTTGGSYWLIQEKEEKDSKGEAAQEEIVVYPAVYSETYITVEKQGMGIVIKVFEDRNAKVEVDKAEFTYNDLTEGMSRYSVGNTPMRRYNLHKGEVDVTFEIGTNNVYEASAKILFKSSIIYYKGECSGIDPINNASNVAYLIAGIDFNIKIRQYLYDNPTIEAIVFETGVAEELPDGAPLVSFEHNGSQPVWLQVDDKTLYVRTKAKTMYANEDCRGMLQYLPFNKIDFEKGFDTSFTQNMIGMFHSCSNIHSFDLSTFNTSNVKYMESMFGSCESLTNLDLSGFDTSNVGGLVSIFNNCTNLKAVNLSSFNISNVRDLSSMFAFCTSLKSVDLSNFVTTNVQYMIGMFANCTSLESVKLGDGFVNTKVQQANGFFLGCNSLKTIDLSNFNTSNITDMDSFFEGCSSFTSIDLSNFDTSNAELINRMFKDCTSLEMLTLGSKFVLPSGIETGYYEDMFINCPNLTTVNYSNDATKSSIQGYGFLLDDNLWNKVTE